MKRFRSLLISLCTLALALTALLAVWVTLADRWEDPPGARADPGVLYAGPAAQGKGDCSGWANACTLQTALSQAASGNEIWVKAGVHYPGSAGQRTATFTLQNDVALYGGFVGTEASRDERDWQANLTVLSGDIDHNDITDASGVVTNTDNLRGENAYHVVSGGELGDAAMLDGFVITAGQADGAEPNERGGGMYNDSSSPTLNNLVFSGNTASVSGGGMFNQNTSDPRLKNVTFSGNLANFTGGGMSNVNSQPLLIDVTFSANTANSGGGAYNSRSKPKMVSTTFSANSAVYGGGLYNQTQSDVTLTGVAFTGNQAEDGGGMYNLNSSPSLTNVVFTRNRASRGGGVLNRDDSHATMTNVTISANSAELGGGIYDWFSDPTLTNCILWGNSASNGAEIYNESGAPTVAYSIVKGGYPGTGNKDADPRFVEPANDNLRLGSGSAAIDAGDNGAVPVDVSVDLDLNPRFVDIPSVPDTGKGTPPIVDMGAYEVQLALPHAVLLPLALRNTP